MTPAAPSTFPADATARPGTAGPGPGPGGVDDGDDSCATGNRFADARTGVREQMQLLRVYAQPGLRNSMLGHPAVDPRLDTHFLKGKVQTWGGLTHTWATADGYGDRILAIYCEMLAWLTDRADLGN